MFYQYKMNFFFPFNALCFEFYFSWYFATPAFLLFSFVLHFYVHLFKIFSFTNCFSNQRHTYTHTHIYLSVFPISVQEVNLFTLVLIADMIDLLLPTCFICFL